MTTVTEAFELPRPEDIRAMEFVVKLRESDPNSGEAEQLARDYVITPAVEKGLYGWEGWTAQQRVKAILAIDEELIEDWKKRFPPPTSRAAREKKAVAVSEEESEEDAEP